MSIQTSANRAWCAFGVAPQGFDVAKKALLEFLDKFKTEVDPADREVSSSWVVAGHHILPGCLQVAAEKAVEISGVSALQSWLDHKGGMHTSTMPPKHSRLWLQPVSLARAPTKCTSAVCLLPSAAAAALCEPDQLDD